MKTILMVLTIAVSGDLSRTEDTGTLTDRLKKISAIAATTAIGNLDALRDELRAGLNAGLTVNEINEVLIQMYAYCGFPRSLQGIGTFMSVINDRKERGITDPRGPEPQKVDSADRYALGKATLEELTGVAESAPSGANAFAPGIDVFLKEHLLADIFGRGVLSYSDRETATVSALCALDGVDPMLRSHLRMASNTGVTYRQLHELVCALEPFIGRQKVENSLSILSEIKEQLTEH